MFQYYIDFWRRYTDFGGTTSRQEFWYVYSLNTIIFSFFIGAYTLPISLLGVFAFLVGDYFHWIFWGFVAFQVTTLIPKLAIRVRRLHDAQLPWQLMFFHFIPVIGTFVMLVLMAKPTKISENQELNVDTDVLK